MQYKTLHVSLEGLGKLLADINASNLEESEPHASIVPNPIRVYPARGEAPIKVELTEWEYKRLLDSELENRYR